MNLFLQLSNNINTDLYLYLIFKYNLFPLFSLNQDLFSVVYGLFSSTLVSKKEGKVIEVFDQKTNITTLYPSIRKAAITLNVDVKSFNCHLNLQIVN